MPTNVSAPLPEVDLQPLSTITVRVDDASAKVTAIYVHGWQDTPTTQPQTPNPTGAFLPG